ncbi:DUF222 domain-containing protein [Nocardia otitidiscaviarum]|uniref:DUF222 domain-containing protein n=1 Tax=Nocardia otitidiscaviarum TaxID=1823 RepID=UPI0011DDAFAD|nr:DUF222 domain-containing protein [Nocardia otitidiscaviarum]MBF6132624.1 DUF222 domain-containing protein [Nocardia otitidiscaviarum]MBF6488725.1 DUF222 domain-containing protein [Nocardia otitidiscaviarum]
MQFRDTDTEFEGLLAEGAISATHARAVMRVMNRLPDAIDTATRTVAEQQLADAARMLAPEQVTHVETGCWASSTPTTPTGGPPRQSRPGPRWPDARNGGHRSTSTQPVARGPTSIITPNTSWPKA